MAGNSVLEEGKPAFYIANGETLSFDANLQKDSETSNFEEIESGKDLNLRNCFFNDHNGDQSISVSNSLCPTFPSVYTVMTLLLNTTLQTSNGFLHHVIKRGFFDLNLQSIDNGRQFVVMQEDASQSDFSDDCDTGLSTLTFMNFVMASISIAANLLSNTNSNSNNNNNNDNNLNKNDNNVNIGNNNNNVNSQNVLMFNPMIGRRSTYARRVLKEVVLESCTNHQVPWLKKSAFHSIDFFVRLQNCAKGKDKIYCQRQEVEKERKNLKLIHNSEEKYVTEHLLLGTAKIAGFY